MIFLPHKSNDIQHLTQEDFMRSKNCCCHLIGPCWGYKGLGLAPFHSLLAASPIRQEKVKYICPWPRKTFWPLDSICTGWDQVEKMIAGKRVKHICPWPKHLSFYYSLMFKTSFVDEEIRATLEKNSKYETVDNVHWTWRVTVFEYTVDKYIWY